MRKLFGFMAALASMCAVSFGQTDLTANDINLKGSIIGDSSGTTPAGPGGGKSILAFRGKSGVYVVYSDGTYARLDSAAAPTANADSLADIPISFSSIADGDILAYLSGVMTNVPGVTAVGDTNHFALFSTTGDTILTKLNKFYALRDTAIFQYLRLKAGMRFPDGTTQTTAAAAAANADDSLAGKLVNFTPADGDLAQYNGSQWVAYDPVKYVWLRDDFMRFTSESGEVGDLGWILAGSTNIVAANASSEANHPGAVSAASTAAAGLHSLILRHTSGYGLALWGSVVSFRAILKVDNTGTDYKARFGLITDTGDDTPPSGVYLERDAAETTWFFVTAVGSSETRTNTSISLSTSVWRNFYVVVSDSIRCYIDGSLVATHSLASGPASTDYVDAGFVVNPTGATARGYVIDYFDIRFKVTR
jgi:hypothetical protein